MNEMETARAGQTGFDIDFEQIIASLDLLPPRFEISSLDIYDDRLDMPDVSTLSELPALRPVT